MPWDNERFNRLQKEVEATLTGKRLRMDVPYFYYLYDPTMEQICLKELKKLEARLRLDGFSVESISFSTLFLNALREYKFLDPATSEKEKENYKAVKEDLQRILLKYIKNFLINHLKGKKEDHCVILLRTGILFPFIHLSNLTSSIESSVKSTLIISYPGPKLGEMLNYHYEDFKKGNYRGIVI